MIWQARGALAAGARVALLPIELRAHLLAVNREGPELRFGDVFGQRDAVDLGALKGDEGIGYWNCSSLINTIVAVDLQKQAKIKTAGSETGLFGYDGY